MPGYNDRLKSFRLILTVACLFSLGSLTDACATTIYSYIDDQANPVYTDAPETIPEKYRAKVKTHERPDPVPGATSVMQSMQRTIRDRFKEVGFTGSRFQINMEGLSSAQSR